MTMRGAAVLKSLLSELALVLLPRGMTPRRFSELARYAFVRAAADISRLRNGRVNYSRVAAQTGLTRADVKRLLHRNAREANKGGGNTAVERVINGWRTDGQFTVRLGRPKPLRITGRRGSFAQLVKKYGGDVPHRAVLDELRRIGAVRDIPGAVQLRRSLDLRQRNNFAFLSPVLPVLIDGLRVASKWDGSKEDGRLRVRSQEYRTAEFSKTSVSELGVRVRDLMLTMLNNATEASWPRVCRTVEAVDIDPKYLPLIRKMLGDRSESALSGVQEELMSNRWKRTDPSRHGVRIGLTIFTHEEEEQEGASNGKRIDTSSEHPRKPHRRPKRAHAC